LKIGFQLVDVGGNCCGIQQRHNAIQLLTPSRASVLQFRNCAGITFTRIVIEDDITDTGLRSLSAQANRKLTSRANYAFSDG